MRKWWMMRLVALQLIASVIISNAGIAFAQGSATNAVEVEAYEDAMESAESEAEVQEFGDAGSLDQEDDTEDSLSDSIEYSESDEQGFAEDNSSILEEDNGDDETSDAEIEQGGTEVENLAEDYPSKEEDENGQYEAGGTDGESIEPEEGEKVEKVEEGDEDESQPAESNSEENMDSGSDLTGDKSGGENSGDYVQAPPETGEGSEEIEPASGESGEGAIVGDDSFSESEETESYDSGDDNEMIGQEQDDASPDTHEEGEGGREEKNEEDDGSEVNTELTETPYGGDEEENAQDVNGSGQAENPDGTEYSSADDEPAESSEESESSSESLNSEDFRNEDLEAESTDAEPEFPDVLNDEGDPNEGEEDEPFEEEYPLEESGETESESEEESGIQEQEGSEEQQDEGSSEAEGEADLEGESEYLMEETSEAESAEDVEIQETEQGQIPGSLETGEDAGLDADESEAAEGKTASETEETENAVLQDSSVPDVQVYLADHYLTSSQYYINKYRSLYRQYVEDLRNDTLFQAELAAWHLATFDMASGLNYSKKELVYNQAILFDILYQEEGNGVSNTANTILKNGNNTAEMLNASLWAEIAKTDADFSRNTVIDIKNDPEGANKILEKLFNSANKSDAFAGTMNKINTLGNVASYANTVGELVQNISKAAALNGSSELVGTILSDMASDATDTTMKMSLTEFSKIMKGVYSSEEIASIMTGETTLHEGAKFLFKKSWDVVTEAAGGVGLSIKIGQAIGKFANALFLSTEKVIENYYTLVQLYEIENLLRKEVLKYQQTFKSRHDVASARKYIMAMRMLYMTLSIGTKYSKQFIETADEGGILGKVYTFLNGNKNAKHQELLDSIDRIQRSIDSHFLGIEEYYLSWYLEDYGDSLNSDLRDNVTVVELPEEELEAVLQEVQDETQAITDFIVNGDVKLEQDITTFGNLYVQSGKLNLNGHTLTVGGNAYHTGGTIEFNEGTLDVGGDYLLRRTETQSNGEVKNIYSYGKLVMQYSDDLLSVGGDFYAETREGYPHTLKAGTIRLKGSFTEGNAENTTSFRCEGSHRVVFCGTGEQTISFKKGGYFNELEMQNEKIALSGNVSINKLVSDMKARCIGTVCFWSSIVNTSLNLNGHSMTLTGDIEVDDNLNLVGGKLSVSGNVYHRYGDISFNSGTLEVGGDYLLRRTETQSNGEVKNIYSYGKLVMQYSDDLLSVGGDFYAETREGYPHTLKAGTIRLKGSFTEGNAENTTSFRCEGSHRVVFCGTGEQTISFKKGGYFNELEMQNEKIALSGNVSINKLVSDMKARCIGTVCFWSSIVNTSLNLNGHSMTLTGDIEVDDNLNLVGGKLSVSGNVYHRYGAISFNSGILEVGGDYLLRRTETQSNGEVKNTYSTGTLVMQDSDDLLSVGGDFYAESGNSHTLKAGTIRLKGDFTEGNASGTVPFICEGSHRVELVGAGRQNIVFNHSNGTFNILAISRPMSDYSFNRENCWVKLIDLNKIYVTGISLKKSSLKLTYGDSASLTATVSPGNASDKAVTWTSSDTKIVKVSGKGKLTTVSSGTATVTATTVDGGFSASCKVTVQKADQKLSAKLKKATLPVNGKQKVTASDNIGKLSYKSSDAKIAVVAKDGTVTAKGPGTVTITVTAAATGKYKKATVALTMKVVPARVSSLSAANTAKGVKLSWKKAGGAAGYYIYRNGKQIKKISKAGTLTFIDKGAKSNGTKYTYQVCAFAKTGKGALSGKKVIYYLSQPGISSVKNTSGKEIIAKWKKNAKATGYEVRYVLGKAKKTKDVPKAGKIKLTITGLEKGKTYQVSVRSYKKIGKVKYYSPWSAEKSVKIKK